MKKLLALTVVMALALSASACAADKDNNPTDTVESTGYKVGVGSYTTTVDSASSVEDSDGKAVVSTTYATVIFDANDIIRKVYIDEVESMVYFDSTGNLNSERNNGTVQTKRELGDAYGMKAASLIGKEWYQQINSLEEYLVGKNIRDIHDYAMNLDSVDNNYNGTVGYNSMNMGDNMGENAADGVVNGAKNIVNGIVDGARNIMGRNGTSGATTDGTTTADGITNDINGMTNGTDNVTNNNDMTNNDNTDKPIAESVTPDRTPYAGNLNWEEDLKSSVTIDMTNIQRALQKAYANAK